MPVDIDAEVIANTPLSADYNVLALAAPEIASMAMPGQFVMVSPGARTSAERSDPLLPRPMAVYRTRPQAGGAEVEILYKRMGRGTRLLAETLTKK